MKLFEHAKNVLDQYRIRPKEQIILENNRAVFYCLSNLTLEWKFFDSFSNPFELIESARFKNYITISKVKKEDEGNYECTGLTRDKTRFLAFGKLFVRGIM